MLPSAIRARRFLTVTGLCLLIAGLRLIPSPPPARADVCGTFPISIACGAANGIAGAVSAVVNIGGKGVQIALNTTSGAISLGGKAIGKIGSAGCWIFDKTIGGGWKTKVCNAATSLVTKVTGLASKATGGGSGSGGGSSGGSAVQAQEPADSPQSYLRTSSIAAGAAFFTGEIAHVISRGTSADLTAPWYHDLYRRVAVFAAGVAVLALLLALLEGAVSGDGALVAAALRAVPFAAVMTFAATALVMAALQIVDVASGDVAGPNLHEATHVLHIAAVLFLALGAVAKASALGVAHGGAVVKLGAIAKLAAFPAAMFAIFGVIAAMAVAAELLLREMAVYAAVLFLPLILAARIWPRLRHAGERLGRVLAAVIVSKFVLVLALAVIAGEILHGGLKGLVVGIAGLFVVSLVPGLFYGLFVLAEHGFTRSAMPMPTPLSAADRMGQVVGWHTTHANEVRGVTAPPPPAPPVAPAPAPPATAPPVAPPPAPRDRADAEEVTGADE